MYSVQDIIAYQLTGKAIIEDFGGEEVLKSLGFVWKEQGCNSHWHILKTYHEKEIDPVTKCEYRGACIGEIMLSTYLHGYIGVSFYIKDYRDYRNLSGNKTVYQNLQVHTLEELKMLVDMFNNWKC